MKRGNRLLALLLSAVLLLGALPLCGAGLRTFAAEEETFLDSPRWSEITAAQATGKYNAGEKCIVLFYRASNPNCQSIGKNVVTPWMETYAQTVFGVNVDTAGRIPSWVFSALGVDTVYLPVVAFVENKSATCFSGATDAVIDAMEQAFFAFTGIEPPPFPGADYTYQVQYHQTEARTMLARINALRTGDDAWCWNATDTEKEYRAGLQPLTYDYELEQAAMQRAAELVADYDHYRPNGKRGISAFAYESAGENIAAGYLTADDVQTGWEEAEETYVGQGHRRTMLNANYTAFGAACAEYNGRKYWVQEFRSPLSGAAETPANDAEASVTVQILDDYVRSATPVLSETSFVLAPGESVALPTVTQRVEMDVYPNETLLCATDCAWESADPAVARVSGGRLIAAAVGETELTGVCANGKPVAAQVRVTGSGARCAVTFDARGGRVSPAGATLAAGESIALPTPEKHLVIYYNAGGGEGAPAAQNVALTCRGWATDANAETPDYACGASFTPTGDTTLYAVWAKSASAVLSSAVPTFPGYNFLGWVTSTEATAPAYQPGDAITLQTDTMLYALWTQSQVTHTVRYDANGGTGAPASQSGADGRITLSAQIPTRSGYVFLGWARTADATEAAFGPGTVCTISGTVTLYAVWAAETLRPTVAIKNFVASRSVPYGAQVKLTAVTAYAPAGAAVHWFVNGDDVFTGDVLTVTVKGNAQVRLRLIGSDGAVLAESETETLTTSAGFFARLIYFFKQLFGIRDVIEQGGIDRIQS